MKSNKNKKIKLVGLVGAFLTVLVVGWLASTTYISKQTEEQVRSLLAHYDKQTAAIRFELLDYQRSLFSAAFVTRLHAKDEALDNILRGLVFRTEVKHGPLIFNKTDLQPARVSFHSYIDLSQVSEDMKDTVARLFEDIDPVNAHLIVGYDLSRHYQLNLSAFEYETSDIVVNVSDGSMSGVIKPKSKDVRLILEMDEIGFKQKNDVLKSFHNELVFNLLGGTQNQLTASMITMGNMGSSTTKEGGAKYTGIAVNIDNLRLEPLLELITRYEDRYSNEQQIEWTLEDAAQYQEGQDRLISLYYEKENLVLPETDLLVSQLFKQGARDISFIKKFEGTELAELAYNK